MKMKFTLLIIFVGAFGIFTFSNSAYGNTSRRSKNTFWVSTAGNDTNSGSEQSPFATIARAQLAVRDLLASGGKGKITVYVHGGTYRLTEPLHFTPQDSAANARILYCAVTDEIPVITGAVSVSGWDSYKDRIVKVDLSNIAPKPTRQLYINGNRKTRARTPDYPASFKPLFLEIGNKWYAPGIQFIPNPLLNPTIPDPALWKNQSQIEALIISQWKMSICRIESISSSITIGTDTIPGLITLQQPGWNNANAFRDKDTGEPSLWSFWQVTRFENALEFLDEPGEWFYNETSKELYYMPAWNEDIYSEQVEIPQLETLIEITGTPEEPVQNITFQGFTFTGATWNAPSSGEGYVADQSGFHLTGEREPNYVGHVKDPTRTPGNISLKYTTKIEFRENIFEHLGAVAVDMVTGCKQNRIVSNIFRDISSAAIQVGGVSTEDARPSDLSSICYNNLVYNNHIYKTGQDYFDSAAIFIGFTQATTIKNNTIIDTPWSGIAIGWGWGLLDEDDFLGLPGAVSGQWGTFDTPTVASNNRIENNEISQFLNVVWDGGAVYSTGQQGPDMKNGTLISGNVAFDKRSTAGGNTFYTDGGSRYVIVRNNVSYNNPIGFVYFGPAPNPLDPLPYPDLSELNIIPYGSDSGGCRTYGDIDYIGNYWLDPNYFSICPYSDENGFSYPIQLNYSRNHTITDEQDVPKRLIKRAGSNLLR